MSSPTDRPDKPDDHSAYAPKSVRDSNRERSHEGFRMPEAANFPLRSEQSIPENAPATDQARAHRPLDTASLREAQVAPRARRPPAEGEGSESYHMPRSLDPQVLRDPPRAPRALGRLAAAGGLI